MRLPGKKSTVLLVGIVIFLVVFAFVLLTYTRRVDGTSMLPTLEGGDLVVIQSVSISDVHVGDIIVYGPPCSNTGASVIHRVITIQNGYPITKGDNNPDTDIRELIASSPIYQSCLVGKVVFVVPYIERLASLPDHLNYVLAFILVLAVVAYELWAGGDRDEKSPREPGL